MKPFQETNYIAKDKENEQWKSSLPPEEVKEKMLAQRGFTQGNTAQRASGDFARHLDVYKRQGLRRSSGRV